MGSFGKNRKAILRDHFIVIASWEKNKIAFC
jgi:hypothetical protein